MPSSHEDSNDLGPLADSLVDGILNHISRDDRIYAEYCRSQRIQVDTHFSEGPVDGPSSNIRKDARNLWYEKKLSRDLSAIDHQHQELVLILQQANDLHLATPERRLVFPKQWIINHILVEDKAFKTQCQVAMSTDR